MRARINTRFAELHTQRTDAETKLAALTNCQPQAADPAILDEIPYAGDIHTLPPDLKARLLDAFDLAILWNKTDAQATVTAVITDATLQALPAILNPGQNRYHDTPSPQPTQPATPAAMKELAPPPIAPQTLHDHGRGARVPARSASRPQVPARPLP
jgi:hypothetical protein